MKGFLRSDLVRGAMAFAGICAIFGPVPLIFLWPFAGDGYETRLVRLMQIPLGLAMAAGLWLVILFALRVLP